VYFQVCLSAPKAAEKATVDLTLLESLNSQLAQLHQFANEDLEYARTEISKIYRTKVDGLKINLKKTVDEIQVKTDEFEQHVNNQPGLFPECVQDAKDLLEAAKVMVGWTMASCHKNVSTMYHNEVEQKFNTVATMQSKVNGFLTEYLDHLKTKNVFKVKEWDVVLAELQKFYDAQMADFGAGVDLNLTTFDQALGTINDEYVQCNLKAETRFTDQKDNILNNDLAACNLKMLRMRLQWLN
jgi:hypothetical protein